MRDAVQAVTGAMSSFATYFPHPSSDEKSAGQLLHSLRSACERSVVEEVRRRVRERVLRRVEVVGAGGRVEGVPNRDLVADHEHALLGQFDEPPKGPRVAPSGVVEALAAGERVRAAMPPFPGSVCLDRLALEVADIDVVE